MRLHFMWFKNSSCIFMIAHMMWLISHQSVTSVVHVVKKNGLRYCENHVRPRGTESLNMLHHSNKLTVDTNITLCLVLLSWELIISATLWLINVPEGWASILWALNRVASLANCRMKVDAKTDGEKPEW